MRPTVNGKEAFGALYDAICNAKHSIDYVCWGFQPSMYFKRDGGKSLRIGDLLIQQAKQGVKVRILCWLDSAWVAQFSEQEAPEYNLKRFVTQNEDTQQRAYDRNWYYCARQPRGTQRSTIAPAGSKMYPQLASNAWPLLGTQSLKDIGIEVVMRDFSLGDRSEIMYREALLRGSGKGPTHTAIGAYGAEPSHHQKTVLIDYEAPALALGFVMGHNTLDAYWDDDSHSYVKKSPDRGRNGETPRQDMSARIAGPILEHLNVNFCRAWQHSTKEDLLAKRMPLAKQLKLSTTAGTPVMAQINRTQSQEGVRNIKSLYLQAVRNATKFIYIENQYFRWPDLADEIKSAVKKQFGQGRDIAKHGSVHLFVVTNSSDEGMGLGAGTTYDMLNALGRADTMPNVARIETAKSLGKQATAAQLQLNNASGPEEKQKAQAKLDSVRRQAQINDDMKTLILPQEIRGLKVHLCTLVAPDSPPTNWMPVYIHSKIMIVDDVFLTHGSANINRRSMEVDSELNICHEHMGVTQPLRRRLWAMHTGGVEEGASDSAGNAATAWEHIIKLNASNQKRGQPPIASLVGFKWTSTKRTRLD
ncbi:phospholipase [Burkholderia vietnamiensis]|uniref:Phospholipase D/Transphosphatidylase n=1 Tax=Burkholderia vietnamiensis (strain G4 / LMG 22486) TaxID=269482 RepID=A4JMB4_BURVG|nr:phospholipase D/Transphosphatidylase [Burkholderia vietnamiensis G4]KVE64959.1 phospholipase [Burkholderia vietnamiensis]